MKEREEKEGREEKQVIANASQNTLKRVAQRSSLIYISEAMDRSTAKLDAYIAQIPHHVSE